MADIPASVVAVTGQQFYTLTCDTSGWLNGVPNDPILGAGLLDESCVAFAMDPQSDLDSAFVSFVTPQKPLANSIGRLISVGGPLAGLVLSKPTDPTVVTSQIWIAPGGRPLFQFINPALDAYFQAALPSQVIGSPQMIVNAYFKPPSFLPMARVQKSIIGEGAGQFQIGNATRTIIRAPFFGRSRFSMSFGTIGNITGNITVVVNGVYFSSIGFPALTITDEQLFTGTVNAPAGGNLTFDCRDRFFHAIEVNVTGTNATPSNFFLNGFVADAVP